MKKLVLSVHQIVDFLLRKGDIDTRIFSSSTMQEGTSMHARYQSQQSDNYLAEYPLRSTLKIKELIITIEGRADGIIKGNNEYTIDEIKTTVDDLDDFFLKNQDWHLGQAKLYAFMFAKEQNLENINIRLTYLKQGKNKDSKIHYFKFNILELEEFTVSLLEQYLEFNRIIEALKVERNNSLKDLKFPFLRCRNGQEILSKYAYSIAVNGGKLFCEAPTGIGKTISTLYPFIKGLLKDDDSKIFYLTAKTSGKESAHNAINILESKGAKLTSILITAKDKICFCKGKGCNPDECPYAKGYYSKIKSIIEFALTSYRNFDYFLISSIAEKYKICPFEFELDISLYSDVIICDYNYMFDPLSYMKRFFDEDTSHYLALVDEAHNLVDRSKEMYSMIIKEEDFLLAKKSIRHLNYKPIKNIFSKLTKNYNNLKINYKNDENTIIEDIDVDTYKFFNKFLDVMVEMNKNYSKDVSKELLDFYLNVNRFIKIYEIKNDSHILYYSYNENKINLHLYCLDASNYLRSIASRIKGLIYFSATLSPIDYYISTLGGEAHLERTLLLPSPFPKENMDLYIVPNISIKYKNRDKTISSVAEYINVFVSQKVGNYLIYLPSYEYLEKLKPLIKFDNDVITLFQEKDMSELEKEVFVENFTNNPKITTVGFAIIGGAFSEGIDLTSDRLIGVAIVGIGLPKINYESNQIADYYSSLGYKGHNFAYLYPAMNKVMQAVGRLIRDEKDKGTVLFIDERYVLNEYRDLFKKEWDQYKVVFSKEELKEHLLDFYNK